MILRSITLLTPTSLCEIPCQLERGTSVNEDVGLEGSGLWDLTSIRERNEILGPEGGWILRSHIDWRRTSVSEDVGSRREWILRSHIDWRRTSVSEDVGSRKGVDCEIPYWLERGISVSEDAGLGVKWRWIVRSHINWREERVSTRILDPEERWIVRSHINWRGKRMPTSTLSPLKEGGLWDPTSVGEGNETFFIRVWKSLPNAF